MANEDMYHVVVQGKEFELTRSQVEFDSPNFFSTSLLGDFLESRTRRLKVSRHPGLFKIITTYLTGYKVLPLSDALVPSDMTVEDAPANLRADAMFYQLDGLIHAIDVIEIPYLATMDPDERYLALLGIKILPVMVDPAKLISDVEDWITMPLTPGRQLKPPFNELESPESAATFDELLVLAAVQGVLKDKLGKRYHNHWRLVGYDTSRCTRDSRRYQSIILIERSM